MLSDNDYNLIHRYATKTTSPDDEKIIGERLQTDAEFVDVLRKYTLASLSLKKIYEPTHLTNQSESKNIATPQKKAYTRWAVAASALILLGLSVFYIIENSRLETTLTRIESELAQKDSLFAQKLAEADSLKSANETLARLLEIPAADSVELHQPNSPKYNHKDLVALAEKSAYSPYTTRGSDAESDKLISDKEYEKAVQLIEGKLEGEFPSPKTLVYYQSGAVWYNAALAAGVSQKNQDLYSKNAVSKFQSAVAAADVSDTGTNIKYYDAARWMLAQCYLLQNQPEKAIKVLYELQNAKFDPDIAKKAKGLLGKIEGMKKEE